MKKLATYALGVALAIITSAQSWAVPITLTYTDPISPGIQQNENNPMVIGHSGQNPDGFDYTDNVPAEDNPQDYTSPEYTVQQIRDIVGNTFSVQIDFNQAGQTPQTLFLFEVTIDGTVAYNFDGGVDGVDMVLAANGNGFSDASLGNISLAGLDADVIVTVRAVWEQDDGFESFFVHSEEGEEEQPVVPEPATLALIGLGLSMSAVASRRRRASK
jgi:hypothetical protein